jgi:apolipoprotein N-acyltransferase
VLNWALALVSAALLILTFPQANLAWLAPVALTPLLVAVTRELRPFRRFLLGWGAGVIYWFGVCYWIQYDLAVYGGLSQAAAWASFALFAVAKALHLAVFALLAGMLMRRWWAVPAVAALWVAVEATHGPLGFAWLALGNAGIDMGIPMRLAPFTGVYGLSFLFVAMAAALALAALRRPRRELLWLAMVPLAILLPRLPDARPGEETALLVQPNISESEEWTESSVDRTEQRLVELSLRGVLADIANAPSIVVWPEMPAPLYSYDEDARLRKYTTDLTRTTHAYLLTGVVAHSPDRAPLNSVELLSPSGRPLSRYDKVNLVPFGEFVPWPFGFVNKISTEAGDFAAGKRVVVSPVNGHRIGTFICYESVFPNFVRQFARGGAEALFNVSNDGWFGKSAARRQHLQIARMRAAENRRWLLRATNDGITATIDPAGRLRGTLPLYVEATSTTGFSYIADRTIYTRFGDWFPLLCTVVALAFLIAERAM